MKWSRFKILAALILAVLLIAPLVYAVAQSDQVQTGSVRSIVSGTLPGYAMEVDSSGHAQVDIAASSATVTVTGTVTATAAGTQASKETAKTYDSDIDDSELIYNGACRFHGVVASAGQSKYLYIYDNTQASGTPVFQVWFHESQTSTKQIVIPGGATFTTGIFCASGDNGIVGAVTYSTD